MATLISRVRLHQDTWALDLDTEPGWNGYSVTIERARPPHREWDGAGAERIIYGLGADKRRMVISGTTAFGVAPPDLSLADLSDPIRATAYWIDGKTQTTIEATISGIESVSMDLLGGTCQWSITMVGAVVSGIDPVTGLGPALDASEVLVLCLIDEVMDTYYFADTKQPTTAWGTDLEAFELLDIADRVLVLNIARDTNGSIWPVYPSQAIPPVEPPCDIVPAPRNIPAWPIDGEPLTGAWIYQQVIAAFGTSQVTRDLWVFVDTSGSMDRTAIAVGLDDFLANYAGKFIVTEKACPNERWMRWVVNAAAGVRDCT